VLQDFFCLVLNGGAVYLGEQLADFCCEDCARGLPCSSAGLGFSLAPEYEHSTGLGLTLPSFISDIQDTLNFVPPAGMSNGLDILNGVAAGLDFVPGVGPLASSVVSIFSSAFSAFGNWLHLGAGRKEADVITGPPNHVQDQVMNQIKAISYVGLNPNATVQQLQALIQELYQLRAAWLTFISNTSHFHDGRASEQAANTVMPYLDGTCGYHWPPPMNPGQRQGCGGAWPTDWGYGAGLLGALEKGLVDRGGQIPPPQLTQGQGVLGIPTLETLTPGQAWLPQPGTLPPVSPIRNLQPTTVIPVGGGTSLTMPLVFGSAAALFLFMRRRQ
jgi:hypothetical protein